jgi:probable F420-dependent oxidoreductase
MTPAVQLGVMLGHAEVGSDRIRMRDFAQTLEGAGLDYLAVPEHVVGAHPDMIDPSGGIPVHQIDRPYHEPFVLFGFLAGVTERLELATSVLVLPQRPTVLVAKQAAELDCLSGGRLRLGVGIGRNQVEYDVLDQEFHTRGARIEEQVAVLRGLWSNDEFSFDGRWHRFQRIGLNPLPVQHPIPIWMGSFRGAVVEKVIERIGRMADGWMCQIPPGDALDDTLGRVRQYAADAGRDPAALGVECAMDVRPGDDPEAWRATAERFVTAGATHLKAVATATGDQPQRALANAELVTRWIEAVKDIVGVG